MKADGTLLWDGMTWDDRARATLDPGGLSGMEGLQEVRPPGERVSQVGDALLELDNMLVMPDEFKPTCLTPVELGLGHQTLKALMVRVDYGLSPL
jgi:hypothetical protein